MTEEWRPIKGFEDLYAISSLGRVKSIAGYKPFSDGRKRFFKERIRKAVPADGYLYVVLSRHTIGKRYLIHRLVAKAFIPNPDNKPCVDHINTDPHDNRASNLRWVTHEENQHNDITSRRLAMPSRPVLRKDEEGNTKVYNRLKDVVKDGFTIQSVCGALRRYRGHNRHGGYTWEYLNEAINNDNSGSAW